MKILLVRLREIGDVVFTTPAVRAVRRRFPDAHIAYLVEPAASAILQSNPNIDELIVALFISGTGAVTLPRRMWDDLRFQIDPTIAAVSTLTIVLTAALMGCAHLLRKRSPT